MGTNLTTETRKHMNSAGTKFAIDKAILERIEKVMPTYHHKRTFINSLLDQAVSRMENERRNNGADWNE
jgi:hypothetical protein